MTAAPDVPRSGRDDPSAWPPRLGIAALALVGAGVAGYLTLVQVRVLASAWDPFFGSGCERVLHSSFSEALPVPDAGVGAVAYLVEIVLALAGSSDRWRRRPWLPLLFEALVLGTAASGIALTVLQVAVVHHFCTLCLASAAVSVSVLALSRLREGRAAWREVRRLHAQDTSLIDALLARPQGLVVRPERVRRSLEARAATAASLTVATAVCLAVAAIGFYQWEGAGEDLVLRDCLLAMLLAVAGIGNLAAPARARRSTLVVLGIGAVLIVLAVVVDGPPNGTRIVAFWADLVAGVVTILCAATSGIATVRAAHLPAPPAPPLPPGARPARSLQTTQITHFEQPPQSTTAGATSSRDD